jgi:hypothetical protein
MHPKSDNHKLIPCPDCEHLCSPAAHSCPNCGKPLAEKADDATLNDKMIDRIMTHSSVKVGMCLTLLGLIKVVESVKRITVFSDEVLAATAFGFMLSGIVSYLALKDKDARRRQKKAKISDYLFTVSLCLLALVCGVVAFEMF